MTNPVNTLYSVGHSNRTIEHFTALLIAHGIQQVIDIRTIPKSRHNPQFNKESLPRSLKKAHIFYTHIKELGGLRHPQKDSINTGWKNLSFRGFADYMATSEFKVGLDYLKTIALSKKTVMMCAEAVPWRCHRSLIADALTKQKWRVFHIQSKKTALPHETTHFLKIRNGNYVMAIWSIQTLGMRFRYRNKKEKKSKSFKLCSKFNEGNLEHE